MAAFSGALLAHLIATSCLAPANVTNHPGLILLFAAVHCATAFAATQALAVLGISAIDDGIERNNAAARTTAIGFWAAIAICAIGAEIGEGEEISSMLAPFFLSVVALLTLSAIFSAATRHFGAIAQDHDRGAGLRLAFLFVAWSSPLAYAAHGDWVSDVVTLRDFLREIPLLLALLVLALALERKLRRTPSPHFTWVPSLLFVAIAASRWWWGR